MRETRVSRTDRDLSASSTYRWDSDPASAFSYDRSTASLVFTGMLANAIDPYLAPPESGGGGRIRIIYAEPAPDGNPIKTYCIRDQDQPVPVLAAHRAPARRPMLSRSC
jgi:hypothetical protein